METFAKLFGSLLALVYHCFDRLVILGHLPLLTRPENIVHFFRDIHQVKTISKALDNLETVRQTLASVTDRFAQFEAQALNVHVDFPLFQRLALPIPSGNTKIPGIKIQDTRMLRLMEVLLHCGTQLGGWRSRPIHEAILSAFQLTPENYTLTQLRYDLRKLKAHVLLERDGSRYAYRLTEKGIRVALMFILFHQRVCGPLANSLFHRQPTQLHTPISKFQAAYEKTDASIQQVIDLLAA